MNPDMAQLEALAKDILRRIMAEEDAADIRTWLAEQVKRLGGGSENAVLYWRESFDFYDELLRKRAEQALIPADQRKVLDWPWRSWNEIVDPLEPGMLAVISAPDGVGKTIVAESIAEHWARRKNHVVFVHYELNRALMLDRRTARHTALTVRELKSGRLTPEQVRIVADIRPRLLAWDGYISYVHTPGWTMERTIDELRKLHADGHCDAVVLDYLEKASASKRQLQMYGTNQFQREADNVEQLKTFAEAMELPVLMVAQMSKEGKSEKQKDLNRNAMRGAGEKSEKANLVALITRERLDDGYSPEVSVLFDKNTMGPSGKTIKQVMQAEYFRIGDIYDPLH